MVVSIMMLMKQLACLAATVHPPTPPQQISMCRVRSIGLYPCMMLSSIGNIVPYAVCILVKECANDNARMYVAIVNEGYIPVDVFLVCDVSTYCVHVNRKWVTLLV